MKISLLALKIVIFFPLNIYIHTYIFFLQHSFLDLEHMPSEESHAKALSLIDQAVKLDNENDLEAGIVIAYSNEKFFPYSL